jgi:hypothetical protein
MARAFEADRARMVSVEREELFSEICVLLNRPDVHERLLKNATWRLRKMFRQERALWESLAARFPRLRDDAEIQKAVRRESQQS